MRAILVNLCLVLVVLLASANGSVVRAQAPISPPAKATVQVTPPPKATPVPEVTQKATPGGPVFPVLTGRVVDQANIIPEELEFGIIQRLQALETKSSDQLVVVTVLSLQGYEIEEYGYRLGRAWQIGQGERLKNGAILLVAPNERKVRIEVGYGLEGVLTDYATGQIIRDTIVPAFKAGNMAEGIEAGVTEIEALLTLDAAELEARAKRGLPQIEADYVPEQSSGSFFVIVFIVIFLWIIISSASRSQKFRTTRRRSGWDGAQMSTHDWRTADVASDVLGGIISIALSGDGEGGGGGGGGGGGFSGGGGSFGGGGSSGSW